MSINYAAVTQMIISPCHPRFGCSRQQDDKVYCSEGCKPIKSFRSFLDQAAAFSYGVGSYDDSEPHRIAF